MRSICGFSCCVFFKSGTLLYRWRWAVEESDSVPPPESCFASLGQHPTPDLPCQLLPAQQLPVKNKKIHTQPTEDLTIVYSRYCVLNIVPLVITGS